MLKSFRHNHLLQKADELTREDATAVQKIFNHLQLPIPTRKNQILRGCDGILIFLNAYGIILRIEVADGLGALSRKIVRVNNSSHTLKPLATLQAGKLIFEICPGIRCESATSTISKSIRRNIKADGYSFTDFAARNVGRIPLWAPGLENGLPVVYDRLACKREKGLQSFMPRFHPQDIFYEELVLAFRDAWNNGQPDADKIRAFWSLCVTYKNDGRLLDDWNNLHKKEHDAVKSIQKSALRYGRYLARHWHASTATAQNKKDAAVKPAAPSVHM